MKAVNLKYTFRTGVYNHGEFSTCILVNNCPSIKDGYEFLSKMLEHETTGASNISHIANESIRPLRVYDYKSNVPVFVSHKTAK